MSDAEAPTLTGKEPKGSRAAVRDRLLEAAEEIFGRRGFAGASISDMTRKAGIAQGSFYLHFPSKEAIFKELIRARGAELRAALREGARTGKTFAEKHRNGMRAFFAWTGAHPWVYRVARLAEFVDPELRAAWYREFAESQVAWLRAGMADGSIPRADPEMLTWTVMGMADFAAMRWMVWEERSELPEELLEEFLRLVDRALGIAEPPRGASGNGSS